MKKKLILYNVIITVVVLLSMFALGLLVTKSNYEAISEKKIKEITAVYAANYTADTVLPASGEVRVTVIDAGGNVLKDSGIAEMEENHLYREEIEAAAKGVPKVVVRHSETLGKEMMYYAEKVETEDTYVYIRVAIPTESIRSYIAKSVPPMLAILLGVWVVSVFASVALSGLLLKPLARVKQGLTQIENGSYQEILPTSDDEDINLILSGINDLGEKLQKSVSSAKSEKQKLDYVLSNVSDGIVVLDAERKVVIANRSVCKTFGIQDPVGKSVEVLTANESFLAAVERCADKKGDEIFSLQVNDRYFLVTVRYTDSNLIIAVLSDVTQTKLGEKMRLEFFANASHELKTPLTAIKGFNDMISLQSKEEPILNYSARIGKEIDRVIHLLGDMLDLSKLENSTLQAENLTSVDLAEVAQEVKEALSHTAAERDIRIEICGEGTVTAEREHIYELMKNLVENGVRYNNVGGKVEICVAEEKNRVRLTVADDGIGIDGKHQSRIFERFYRVDKSRSRATGGTGLGLAIVKHICDLYNAEISLKSKLGAGTTIEITFTK